jgi:hypothetical protein
MGDEVNQKTVISNQLLPKENSIRDFYAHTSRVWNSTVTITVAMFALSITALFAIKEISIIWRVVVALSSFTALVYLGFYRIVEFGCQLQFLETELIVRTENGEQTLLEFINGVDGNGGYVPRIRSFKRLSLEAARNLKGLPFCFSYFAKNYIKELLVLGIIYILVLIITGIKLPW